MIDTSDLPLPKKTENHGKHPERLTPKQFRDAVWIRDGGKDRATGRLLFRDACHLDDVRGEVCHLRGRRVMPEWATDPRRAVLLSAVNHILSDARGGNRLTMTDPKTGDRADDASKPIRFTLHDRQGRILWTRVS